MVKGTLKRRITTAWWLDVSAILILTSFTRLATHQKLIHTNQRNSLTSAQHNHVQQQAPPSGRVRRESGGEPARHRQAERQRLL
jgi:hypothetical protein